MYIYTLLYIVCTQPTGIVKVICYHSCVCRALVFICSAVNFLKSGVVGVIKGLADFFLVCLVHLIRCAVDLSGATVRSSSGRDNRWRGVLVLWLLQLPGIIFQVTP